MHQAQALQAARSALATAVVGLLIAVPSVAGVQFVAPEGPEGQVAPAPVPVGEPIAAQRLRHKVHFIYMGGDDCPSCVVWRRAELPRLALSDAFRASRYSFVNKPILSGVPGLFLLPDEVKPYKAVLDQASGGNMGSPHYAILVDGVLQHYGFSAPPAERMEQMLRAALTDGRWPEPTRCLMRRPRAVTQCAESVPS